MRIVSVVLVMLVLVAGCSKAQQGTYTVTHKPSGKTYYIDGPPINHKDNATIGLPGQWKKCCYHFTYGLGSEKTLVSLPKADCTVESPDGSIEDVGKFNQ